MRKDEERQILTQIQTSFDELHALSVSAGEIKSDLLSRIDKRKQDVLTAAKATCTENLSALDGVVRDMGSLALPWSAPEWSEWKPATSFNSASRVRVGSLSINESVKNIAALAPFSIGPGLLFCPPQERIAQSKSAIHSLLLRLLAAFPPGKLRFVFIDPSGRGDNVAAFMHLLDHDPRLVTSKAWTEPEDIDKQLCALTGQIEYVIQKYLRNTYKSIDEYNNENKSIPEPYKVLVVFDFPMNFSLQAVQRLISISQSGPRCGVIPIIQINDAIALPHGASSEMFFDSFTYITDKWDSPIVENFDLELDASPGDELTSRIVEAIGKAAENVENVAIPFSEIAPPPEKWWLPERDCGDCLSIAIGPKDARKHLIMTVGESNSTAHHVLIAGKTGSGKSTLLHTLIMNLALTYSPDDLHLYLIDFKKVEFKLYAVHKLPHAQVIAVESDREFGLSVLEKIDRIMDSRLNEFRSEQVENIAGYRKKKGKMPRILLLMDEFQVLFQEDDVVGSNAAHLLDKIVRLGRAPGIHVVMASQTLANAFGRGSARNTLSQMGVRIALQCSETDSTMILGDGNLAARLLDRPGEAIYNDKEGRREENIRFQIAWLEKEERETLLKALAEKGGQQGGAEPIVFEGAAMGKLINNPAFRNFKDQDGWPTPPKQASIFIGEPVTLGEQVSFRFARRTGANLLVVGNDIHKGMSTLGVSLIGLVSQFAPMAASFYMLLLSGIDEPGTQTLNDLASRLPHKVTTGRARDLSKIIGDLGRELDDRISLSDDDLPRQTKPIFLFIHGLQRGKEFQQSDGSSSGSWNLMDCSGDASTGTGPSAGSIFKKLLRDGPDVGIHTLVWCDTVRNFDRILGHQAFGDFAERVAFQMPADDLQRLLDIRSDGGLGPYRGLCYSEDSGELARFRPYELDKDSLPMVWDLIDLMKRCEQ